MDDFFKILDGNDVREILTTEAPRLPASGVMKETLGKIKKGSKVTAFKDVPFGAQPQIGIRFGKITERIFADSNKEVEEALDDLVDFS